MTTFSERYTGQPSPGAALPLPCNGVRAESAVGPIPAAVLEELRAAPLTTGMVIGRLGYLDSPVMRKMVARELQSLGFQAQLRRSEWSPSDLVRVWVPAAERR